MEKEHQPDSMSTVTMKPEYPPSEVYSTSEPPPAYRHPRSTAVQIARIAAFTIVLSSMILGGFILASSYVQARAGCQELQQLDALLDKEMALEARELQNEDDIPRRFVAPQALHQDIPMPDSLKKIDDLQTKESRPKNDEKLQSIDSQSQDDSSNQQSADSSESSDSSDSDSNDSSSDDDSSEEMGRIPIKIHLPLQLDLDDIAGALLEKNQKSRMNCVIEKRRAEELVDHQSRSLQLPFGLNLTTPPRLEKVTGEKMVIICESGNEQRVPENVEILRGFHLPLAGPVSLPIQFPVPPMSPYRPPVPAQHMQAPSPQAPQDYQVNEDVPVQRQGIPQFIPRHLSQPRLMVIREQTIPMPQQQESRAFPFFIKEQISNHLREQQSQVPQMIQIREEEPKAQPMEFHFREDSEPQIPAEVREQIGQHIKEQLMRQQQMRDQIAQAQRQNAFQERQMPFRPVEQMRPVFMRAQPQEEEQISGLPLQMDMIPREVRILIQRILLPQEESEEVPQDSHSARDQKTEEPTTLPITTEELQAVHQAVQAAEEDQEQEQNAQQQAQQQSQEAEEQQAVEERNAMIERQAMERFRPIDIPVPMMIKDDETPVQDPERPHYVQPRSIKAKRSIDSVLQREKRVKRCSCDCAC